MADDDSELETRLLQLITEARPDDPVGQLVVAMRLWRRVLPDVVVPRLAAEARKHASITALAKATGLTRARMSQLGGPLPPEEARRRQSRRTAGPDGA